MATPLHCPSQAEVDVDSLALLRPRSVGVEAVGLAAFGWLGFDSLLAELGFMGEIHVSTPARRDRLWLIAAFSIALLTLLGAAGEELGYDRMLRTSTTKRRTHSLLRQRVMLYELIPTMPEHRLLPLIARFAALLQQQPVFTEMFGPI